MVCSENRMSNNNLLTRLTTFEGVKVPLETQKTLIKWFSEDKVTLGTSLREFAKRRGIKPSTFSDWVQNTEAQVTSGIWGK